MILFRIALAFLLLSTGVKPDGLFPLLHHELQFLCVELELMDDREIRYTLSNPDEWLADIAMIRKRQLDLRYAPNVWEHNRFGFVPRETCSALIQFNRAYVRHLEALRDLYPGVNFDEEIAEADELYFAWDALRDSKVGYYFCHIRRAALARVRDRIGAEAFERGEMVPHVPFARFTTIR